MEIHFLKKIISGYSFRFIRMVSIQENINILLVFLNKTMPVLTAFVNLNQNHQIEESRWLCQMGM